MSSYTTRLAQDSTTLLRETYTWIQAYIGANGHPPAISEIAAGLHLTPSGAYARLKKMEARRWIHRDARKRSITLRGIK